MLRTFATHIIRRQRELTGSLWDFTPCLGEHAGKVYRVATPCCWENHPEFTNYRGEGEYTTRFSAGGNIRLEFKGVSHTASVYLDGKKIASHYNAYTIFDAIVTDLENTVHTLTIQADNRFSKDSALHIPNDYMSYGGVSRPVVLEQLRGQYIRSIRVTPHYRENCWHAEAEVEVQNISGQTADVEVQLTLAGQKLPSRHISLEAGASGTLCWFAAFEEAEEWSPENPALYEAAAYLKNGNELIDDLIDRFGFRRVEISGKDILLNGKKLRIRGLCRHEDHPQFGCALPYSAIAADLEIIRHLGANSVRTSHYPNDELFLDLCDEQGILVWEENHARGLSEADMKNPNFEAQAERVIEEMIPAHYNHPSIYIWGILNECASDSEYGRECYRKQFELIRKLDSSRPCSFASCKFKTDICFDLPDVVSYNIYPLWYHDTPVDEYLKDLYCWVQEETGGAGKPFLVTEIGAGGIYGYRNPAHSKWTEEYQAMALEQQLTGVLKHPDCTGVYIWQFCDIRVSEEWFGGRPRTMNNKGIVDEYRRRKLSYNVVRRIFLEDAGAAVKHAQTALQ